MKQDGTKNNNKNTIMGFFSDIISATVKVALTPVSIVKDVVNVATDKEPNATKDLLESADEDLSNAFKYE